VEPPKRLDFLGYGLGTFERIACETPYAGEISRDRPRETRNGPHGFEYEIKGF